MLWLGIRTLTKTHMLPLLTLVSLRCMWFALVLLLAFVNSSNCLCLSKSCKLRNDWKAISLWLSFSHPPSPCLFVALCRPLTCFTVRAFTSVGPCHACLCKAVTCDPCRPRVRHIQCRPLLLTVSPLRTKKVSLWNLDMKIVTLFDQIDVYQ